MHVPHMYLHLCSVIIEHRRSVAKTTRLIMPILGGHRPNVVCRKSCTKILTNTRTQKKQRTEPTMTYLSVAILARAPSVLAMATPLTSVMCFDAPVSISIHNLLLAPSCTLPVQALVVLLLLWFRRSSSGSSSTTCSTSSTSSFLQARLC